jgi:type III secretion protein Q
MWVAATGRGRAEGAGRRDEAVRGAPPAEALALPAVAPAHVALLNRLHRPRAPLAVSLAGRTARLSAGRLPGRERPRMRIGLAVDGRPAGDLSVPEELVAGLMAGLGEWPALRRLDPEPLAILLEHALEPAIAALERDLGARLSLASVEATDRPEPEHPEAGRPALGFALAVDGLGRSDAVLSLDLEIAERLVARLHAHAAAAPAALDITVPVRLVRAVAAVRLGELGSLAPGDVVLVDADAGDGAAVAVIAGSLAAPAAAGAAGVTLAAAPVPGRGSAWEWSMDEKGSRRAREAQADAAPDDAALDDLAVTLAFEAGRVELTLGEVKRLGAGSVVPLARPADEALDVLANGRRIGRGELVRIGDAVGVRITRLFGDA